MPSGAVIYKVQGPSGLYFALHDPQTGRVWTERSEQAARAQAQELGLVVGVAKSASHDELMRLIGRDFTRDAVPISPGRPAASPPVAAKGADSESPPRPIRSSAPFLGGDDPPVMVSKSEGAGDVFASGNPVAPPAVDEQGAGGDHGARGSDVLESKRKLPKGTSKSPFADNRNRKRRS